MMKHCKKTILIAEDDRDLLEVLRLRCLEIGLKVIAVDNALDALNAIRKSAPHVICMDIDLPGGNGLAARE